MIRRDMDHQLTATRRKTNSHNRATVLFMETISVLQLSTPLKVMIGVYIGIYCEVLLFPILCLEVYITCIYAQTEPRTNCLKPLLMHRNNLL